MNEDKDLSLKPVPLNTHAGSEYSSRSRRWQGIPGIERAPGGRLWATWYSGGPGEGPENYVLAVISDHPSNRLEELLPDHWKLAARAA